MKLLQREKNVVILSEETRINDDELIKALNSERVMHVANGLYVEVQFRKHSGAYETVTICKQLQLPTTTENIEIASNEIDEAMDIILKTAEEVKQERVHSKENVGKPSFDTMAYTQRHQEEDDAEELEFLQYAGLCALSEMLRSHVILLIPEAVWEEKLL